MIDFQAYWEQIRADIAHEALEYERISRDEILQAHGLSWRIDWIRFWAGSIEETWGWWATPIEQESTGTTMLWLPGYSYGTPPPDTTCLIPGASTLCINVHGNKPDEPYVNPAGKNDYILQEIGSPESYIYRTISIRCLIAVKVALKLPETRLDRFVTGGMSQGGTLAIIAAAHSPEARLCFAAMPFLADIRNALLKSNNPSYRLIKEKLKNSPEIAEQILETLELFDPVKHAPLLTAPIWLCAGGKDPAVKPATVEAVFQAVRHDQKQYQFFPNSGHVFLPEMNQTHTQWIQHYITNEKEKEALWKL
jgi:cephalosporin-C deacetylase-like acetyl esterase